MTLGEKIFMLRKQHGLTLEDVGNAVGVGKSTVRKWENGIIANMKRDKIQALANILQTTPQFLMGWEEKEKTAVENDSGISEAKQKLFDLANSCSDEEAERILQVFELIVGKK